jgi:hypothetical protein
MIVIEEQHYSNQVAYDNNSRLMDEKYPGWRDAFSFEWDDYRDAPNADILDEEEAATLYNKYNEDKVEIDEDGEIVDDTDRNKVILCGVDLGKFLFGLDGNAVRPIHDTREEYTTKGLINRHEIALTVPTIESWGKSDMIHFGDAGDGRAVAWIRFGETQIINESTVGAARRAVDEASERERAILDKRGKAESEEEYRSLYPALEEAIRAREEAVWAWNKAKKESVTKKVLVIDEIQSKRHQEGRDKGYKSPASKRLLEEANALSKRLAEFEDELRAKYKIKGAYSTYELMPAVERKGSEEDYERYISLNNERNAKYAEYEQSIEGVDRNAPFDAPFDKNWHELAMKRMLRYAAENGYDVVAWTKGEQQAERYELSNIVESILAEGDWYDSGSTKQEEKTIRNIVITMKSGGLR